MLVWSPILAAMLAAGTNQGPVEPKVTVSVDSSKKELIVTAGPFDIPNMPPMADDAMMDDHGASHDTPIQRFRWPIDAWVRGFELELKDAQGNPVPRDVIHHMIMVNFSRRMLLYPAPERLLGAGTETEDIKVPKTIGVPMKPRMKLGMYVAWHNDTGKDLKGVHMTLRMLWMPKNQNPQPVNSLPIYMDVNLTVGGGIFRIALARQDLFADEHLTGLGERDDGNLFPIRLERIRPRRAVSGGKRIRADRRLRLRGGLRAQG